MLAHRVDRLDRRAAAQQLARRRAQIFDPETFGGQRQQARSAAGDKHEQQVVLAERPRAAKDFVRRFLAARIRHRMPGFDHGDAIGEEAVLVTGDDQPVERRVGRPVLFDRERHGGGSLAGADDERATARRLRQMRRHDLQRVGGRERGAKAREQQFARWPGVLRRHWRLYTHRIVIPAPAGIQTGVSGCRCLPA